MGWIFAFLFVVYLLSSSAKRIQWFSGKAVMLYLVELTIKILPYFPKQWCSAQQDWSLRQGYFFLMPVFKEKFIFFHKQSWNYWEGLNHIAWYLPEIKSAKMNQRWRDRFLMYTGRLFPVSGLKEMFFCIFDLHEPKAESW